MQPPKFYLFFIILLCLGCSPKTGEKSADSELDETSGSEILPEDLLSDSLTVTSSVLLDTYIAGKKDTSTVVDSALPESDRVIATLKATPCYGKCPVYELKFWESQYVVRRGYAYTDNIGYYEAKIPGKVLEEIKRKARQSGLYAMEDRYPTTGEFLDDYPSVITHVFDNRDEKRIVNIYDAPPALTDFENFLLETVRDLKWVKAEEAD